MYVRVKKVFGDVNSLFLANVFDAYQNFKLASALFLF